MTPAIQPIGAHPRDAPMTDLSDHDLLLTIAAEVRETRDDVRDLTATMKDNQKDHEVRIRLLEKRVWSIPALPTVLSTAAFGLAMYDRFRGGK